MIFIFRMLSNSFFMGLLFLISPVLLGCATLNDVFERNFSLDSKASYSNDLPELKKIWFFCERCLNTADCKSDDIKQCNVITLQSRNDALTRAVERANIETVYFLVDVAKTDVNGITGRYQETPLIVAAYYGTEEHQKIADFLLSHGADIDAMNLTSRTALMTAIWKKNVDFAEFLLKKGANPSATPRGNINGLACRYAVKKNLVKLLPSIPGCCSFISKKTNNTNDVALQCEGNASNP